MEKSAAGGLVQPPKVQGASGPAASSSAVSVYGSQYGLMIPQSSRGPEANQPFGMSSRKDPRPNDNASIVRHITELHEFLISYNYPHSLTLEQVMQPSAADFRSIFEFLVRFLKPNYRMGKNVEAIVPKRLKMYGYPFSIPKSHFQAVGIPQTWSKIVLALTWLRVSIQRCLARDFDTTMFTRREHDFGREGRQKLLFDYTNESYDMFMHGADEFDDLRAQYEKKFEGDSDIDKEIEALTRERDQNKLIYEELMSEPDNLAILEEHSAAIQCDIEKVERYQTALGTHLTELKAAFNLCCADEKEEADRLALLESEREKKQHVVESQSQAGIDFQKLMKKVSALRRQVASKNQEISDRKINIQKLEAEIDQDYEEINTIVIEFNRIRRQLLPEDKDLELTMDITESEKVRLVSQIRDIKTKLMEQAEGLDEILMKEKEKADMLEESLNENEREKAKLCAALTERNSQLTDLKESQEKKLKDIDASVESLKAGQQDIKTIEMDLIEDNKRLQKEELAVADLEARFKDEEKRCREYLGQVAQFIIQHVQQVDANLLRIRAGIRSLMEKVLAVNDASSKSK